MSSYFAANGQEITDDMIDRWCASYERGEFPEGERTVGDVRMGCPSSSSKKTSTLEVEIPQGMKATLDKQAERQGLSTQAYALSLLTDNLLANADTITTSTTAPKETQRKAR